MASDGLHLRRGYWYFYARDADGRLGDHSTGTRNYQLARSCRAKHLADLESGSLFGSPYRVTFKAAARQWLTNAEVGHAQGTIRAWRSRLTPLEKFFGHVALNTISPRRIANYQHWRHTQRCKPQTINRELELLRVILTAGNAWTAAHLLHCKPLKREPAPAGRALTLEEQRRLLAAASGSKMATMRFAIIIALRTGLRSAELRNLRIADIEFPADAPPRLYVRRSTTKTDSGERVIGLAGDVPDTVRQLAALAARRGSYRRADYFFPAHIHGRWDPRRPLSRWPRAWDRIRRAAGLAEIRFHDLRHTNVTDAALAGIHVEQTMANVGHMNARETRLYTHIRASLTGDYTARIAAHQAGQLVVESSQSGSDHYAAPAH